jgi:outer membrane protein assembly factor BamB
VIDVLTGKTVDEFDCPPGTPDLMHDGVLLLTDRVETDPVHAFHLAERRPLWEANLIVGIRERCRDECHRGLSFVASYPGQFVVSSGQSLVGVSLADGSLRWATSIRVPYSWPQVKDGQIYAWTTASAATSTKVTLDLGSGQVSRERSQPGTGENRFVIVDEATGEIVMDRPLAPYGEPFQRFQELWPGTLCKNHIVFTTQSGLLAVFRLSDGELVWRHEHGDELYSPVFEDNRLYVACADGTLVVFEAEGGEL